MDPWTKLNFQKIQNLEFGISWMYFVCQNVVFLLYLESWKVVHSEISFILTNLSLPWLKCCTKEAWLKLKFSKHPENRTWTFLNVFSLSKCHHSNTFEIVISKFVYFEISLIASKLPLSCLSSSTIDPWMKLNFPKHPKIKVWAFLNVFRVSKCHLIPTFGIIQRKVVHFEISLIVTKFSLPWLKCPTMKPWLKLKFSKHSKIRTSIFVSVFSVLKCHYSHTFEIIISKFVYFEISLIASKLPLSCL